MEAEKLLQVIEKVDVPTRYDMKCSDMRAIYESSGDAVDCIIKAFKYGFLKGQRAAANKSKTSPRWGPDSPQSLLQDQRRASEQDKV